MSTTTTHDPRMTFAHIGAARRALGEWAQNEAGIPGARALNVYQLCERIARDDRAAHNGWAGVAGLDAAREILAGLVRLCDYSPSDVTLGDNGAGGQLEEIGRLAWAASQSLRTAAGFDHADYAANPLKYRLFQTAIMTVDVPANRRGDMLHAGEVVDVTWLRDEHHAGRNREEPVYYVGAGVRGTTVYGDCLSDFVL